MKNGHSHNYQNMTQIIVLQIWSLTFTRHNRRPLCYAYVIEGSVPNGTQYGSISKVKELTDYTKYELKQ